jgi:hypothetical protein
MDRCLDEGSSLKPSRFIRTATSAPERPCRELMSNFSDKAYLFSIASTDLTT